MAHFELSAYSSEDDRRLSASPSHLIADTEQRLLEYLDGRLPAAEASVVEAHLSVCAECQAFAYQWRQLDPALAKALRPTGLPADFTTRLWKRIQAEPIVRTHATLEQERARLQAECEADWVARRRHELRRQLPLALDYVGYGALAALGGYLFFGLMLWLLQWSPQPTPTSLLSWIPAGSVALGMAIPLCGAAFMARRQIARWVQQNGF